MKRVRYDEQEKMHQKVIKVLKWVLFVALSGVGFLHILLCLYTIPVLIYTFISEPLIVPVFNDIDKYNSFELDVMIFYIPILCSTFAMYIYAKVFGVFKFIDNLNIRFIKKLGCVVLISVPVMLAMFVTAYIIINMDMWMNFYYSYYAFSLIPAFFLYKFFQFLTKKYPRPFEKIGYYCSIEFYKQLLTKLKKN